MTDLNELSAQEIGRRLRLARENAGLRQEEAARLIETSRPTLVAIEQGVRRIRIQELQILANHYGLSANNLLRREAVHTDLVPRFRKLRDAGHQDVQDAILLLNDLVKAEVELENVLGIDRDKTYPRERNIESGDVSELAEKHAQDLRDFLGLGSGPISDIFSIIEFDLGIRLYQRRLSSGSKVAGLFTYDPVVGACILLNASHPLERRYHSAAHELGHFCGTRQSPEVFNDDETFLSRDERYANAFARSFLMPRKSFEDSFRQLTAGVDKWNRRHVILLAYRYNISREACVRRLEELGLAKKGAWEWFEMNGGITNAQAREVLGDAAMRIDRGKTEADHLVSHRIGLMAHTAWKRGIMSEGQLADLLRVPRLEVRRLIDQIELEESDTDDVLKLSR